MEFQVGNAAGVVVKSTVRSLGLAVFAALAALIAVGCAPEPCDRFCSEENVCVAPGTPEDDASRKVAAICNNACQSYIASLSADEAARVESVIDTCSYNIGCEYTQCLTNRGVNRELVAQGGSQPTSDGETTSDDAAAE